MADKNFGKVVQVIGSTLDAQFAEDQLPGIYNALHVLNGVDFESRSRESVDQIRSTVTALYGNSGPQTQALIDSLTSKLGSIRVYQR